MRKRGAARLLSAALVLLAAACGSSIDGQWLSGEQERHYAGIDGARVEWIKRLTPKFEGPYLPVEWAAAELDPNHDRLYVGTTAGRLYAMTTTGRHLYDYYTESSIESQPTLEPSTGVLYIGTEDGHVHAVDSDDGSVLWKENAGGALRQKPLLVADAVYTVTESDVVTAFNKTKGELLWSYQRDQPDGFGISRRAGLAYVNGNIITGFADGTVVALDAADGTVTWERETSLDLPVKGDVELYYDVDTTPTLAGRLLYVASFSGGLYGLDPRNGTVEWRDDSLTGIVHLAATKDYLVAASGELGLMAIRLRDHVVHWTRPNERGAPGQPIVVGRTILVGESGGAFLSLGLDTGEELSRFESGHGFSASASVRGVRGYVLSNGGSLFAFRMN